jgi:hypothetical protein
MTTSESGPARLSLASRRRVPARSRLSAHGMFVRRRRALVMQLELRVPVARGHSPYAPTAARADEEGRIGLGTHVVPSRLGTITESKRPARKLSRVANDDSPPSLIRPWHDAVAGTGLTVGVACPSVRCTMPRRPFRVASSPDRHLSNSGRFVCLTHDAPPGTRHRRGVDVAPSGCGGARYRLRRRPTLPVPAPTIGVSCCVIR